MPPRAFTQSGITRRWCMLVLLVSVFAACTKRNPDLCCTTDAECAAIGFSSHAPCDLGVCVKNECTTATNACDDDTDCPVASPACVASTCAVCATSATCPISAPVCDNAVHDCRACFEDTECDSLACDLVAGTCVQPANILYVSPNGAAADLCTRNAPCSLRDAAPRVDTDHPYIVLLPGHHISGAHFENKTVTIAGNNATIEQIDATTSTIGITGGAIILRDVQIEEHLLEDPSHDGTAVISAINTTIHINNIISHTTLLRSILAFGPNLDITLTNSTFTGHSIETERDSHVLIDRCTFETGPAIQGNLEISNSVIVASVADIAISISQGESASGLNTIYNNTIIGGQLICSSSLASFNSNIILGSSISNGSGDCSYAYNLFSSDIAASNTSNLIGDPMFVDAASRDFHLSAHSPARDAADPFLTSSAHDFDGTPRPQGPRYDIGAFEYTLQHDL